MRRRLRVWLRLVSARDALVFAGLTAAVFLIAFLGFVRMFTDPRADASGNSMAAYLGGVVTAYEQMPPGSRDAFLDALVDASDGAIVRDEPGRWGLSDPRDEISARSLQRMRTLLPPGRVAFTAGSPRQVWLSLPAPGGGSHWLRVPVPDPANDWSIAALAALATAAVVACLGAAYLGWRLRYRVRRARRALEDLSLWEGRPPADASAGRGTPDDPQPHLEALAARLTRAARERAVVAAQVGAALRAGLAELAAREPALAAPDAARALAGVHQALARLPAGGEGAGEAPGSPAAEPGPGARSLAHRRWHAWRGIVADLLLVAALFGSAVGLSAVVVSRVVLAPRVEAAADLFTTIVGGIHATYATLPAHARPAYLASLGHFGAGSIEVDDPARWPVTEPRLGIVREFVGRLRHRLPHIELQVTPLPHSLLWVRLQAPDGERLWIRMGGEIVPQVLRSALAGLSLVLLGAAALVVWRARRRLAWVEQTLDAVDTPLAPAASDEDAPVADRAIRELQADLRAAALSLAHASDEDELRLARLADELHAGLTALRAALPRATEAPGTAPCLASLFRTAAGLDWFARRRAEGGALATDLNAVLRALHRCAVDPQDPRVRWSLGGLPLVDIPRVDACRLAAHLLDNALRHGQPPVEVSTTLEGSWIVLRVSDRGPGPAAPGLACGGTGLAVVRRIIEANGGLLRLDAGPDGGLHAQAWLRPARPQDPLSRP